MIDMFAKVTFHNFLNLFRVLLLLGSFRYSAIVLLHDVLFTLPHNMSKLRNDVFLVKLVMRLT